MRPVDEIGHVRIVARHQAQLRTRALWKCNGLCIIVRFKKSLDLLRTFFSEYRTNGIEEPAAGSDDGPKGFQKAFLLLREGNNIVRATRKNDLGVTTHDAACRAGCIKQDGIKRLAIPPTGDVGRVAHANICLESQSREVFLNTWSALRVGFQSRDRAIGEFEHVRRFAAGGGACVENAFARFGGKEKTG